MLHRMIRPTPPTRQMSIDVLADGRTGYCMLLGYRTTAEVYYVPVSVPASASLAFEVPLGDLGVGKVAEKAQPRDDTNDW